MDTQTPAPPEIEYETYQIGVAYLVKDILDHLEIVDAIDSVKEHQPEIGCANGNLAQVIINQPAEF